MDVRAIERTCAQDQDIVAIPEEVGQLLAKKGWRLAVAETSTGGFIGSLLTAIPGSSLYFDCSIVAYSNHAKETSLEIPAEMLRLYGAVSLLTALTMALNVRRLSQVDVGLAVTGLTGPRVGRSQKPIGLTYIALALPDVSLWWERILPGDRVEIQHKSACMALEILRDALLGHDPLPHTPP